MSRRKRPSASAAAEQAPPSGILAPLRLLRPLQLDGRARDALQVFEAPGLAEVFPQLQRRLQKLHPNHGDRLAQRAGRLKDARADCASGLDLIRRLEADKDFFKTSAAICARI